MAKNTTPFTEASSAVQTHLSILQGVIQRMADNSRSCKTWCITITSAVLILVARIEKPDYVLIALVPTVLFLLLDTYYLALERSFRASYNAFVEKLHKGDLTLSDLYIVAPTGSIPGRCLSSLSSFAIWPFYLTLLLMIGFAWLGMNS